MPAVEFKNVDIVFGKKQAAAIEMIDAGASRDEILAKTGCVLGAAGIDLQVQRGEICVLMGLSGSGKSTVLRAINRLNKVARGSVLVEHADQTIDVTQCDAGVLRELRMRTVATVFQQFALLPWRTVRKNVEFGLELRGMAPAERRAVVDEKLAMVGLSAWSEKYANELSGGMQQRVGLARAFATDADILLMDEPFSALDPLIRDKLQDELLDLQARLRKTIVFVSHDLDEAMKLGSRIAIMQGGRIVQFGTAEDILLRPADDYVAEFVKHMNPLNVLRGTAVMRPAASLARDGTAILLDGAGRVRLELDHDGRPLRVLFDGGDCKLAECTGAGDTAGITQSDVLTAPVDLKLRAAIALKRQTMHPIVLVDQLGRLAGLCGDEEIYLGLLRRRGAS
jgi:glycine betaine/proline transport system ATP-binding protein